MNTELNEGDIRIPIEGCEVTSLMVDYSFRIDFWLRGADEFRFYIRTAFHLRTADRHYGLDPHRPRSELAPALDIYGKIAESAVARADGVLELRFTDGTEILVPVDPMDEAWKVVGPLFSSIISLPGGGLHGYLLLDNRDGTGVRHHRVSCDRCHVSAPLEDCALNVVLQSRTIVVNALQDYARSAESQTQVGRVNFDVSGYELTFQGLCEHCQPRSVK